jgi:hypothetical protein
MINFLTKHKHPLYIIKVFYCFFHMDDMLTGHSLHIDNIPICQFYRNVLSYPNVLFVGRVSLSAVSVQNKEKFIPRLLLPLLHLFLRVLLLLLFVSLLPPLVLLHLLSYYQSCRNYLHHLEAFKA